MAAPFSKNGYDKFPKAKPFIQQGIEDSVVDYYDILVIGRTGMGKSTTSDKLVIANLKNLDYRGEPYVEETVQDGRMFSSDLSIWLISETEGELERLSQRLKNLVMFRGLDDPHEQVNDFYKTSGDQTTKSRLISNETTRLRILDVPGFFGKGCDRTPEMAPNRITAKALGIMREVLQIQATMRMNFKRILYFIPERGPLERCHEILQMELEHMVHYFGKSIFDCMVLAATINPDVYQFLQPGITPFSNDAEMKTRQKFQEALNLVLRKGEQLPDLKPPIIFISMNDTCEEIFMKIKSAPVIFDGVRLAFDRGTCARCGIKTKFLGEGENEVKVACYIGEDPSKSIPYEESHCHPMIIPKYWTITKVIGGIAHVITGKMFLGKWPDFHNPDDEICVHCGQVPGICGCQPVNTYYELKGGQLLVEHKCDTREPIEIESSMDQHQHIQQPSATVEQVALPMND